MVMISVEISANRHGWSQIQILLLLILSPILVWGNTEGDALNALRQSLTDPNNVLQSWDPTLVNPCTWFHVTCNSQNSVIRVDLGNAGLAGQLVPQLENLTNLQYLEMYSNNISGVIPVELGNLTKLISLDLYQNKLTGVIPHSLGSLRNLRFLRLNNNSLTGIIPDELTNIVTLETLDLSYNDLVGEVPSNGSFSLFNASSFVGNKNLCGEILNKQCPGEAPFPGPSPYGAPASTPYGAPTSTPYGAPVSSPYGAPASSPCGAPTPTPTPTPDGAQAPSPSSGL